MIGFINLKNEMIKTERNVHNVDSNELKTRTRSVCG